jgi:hypothetical protein
MNSHGGSGASGSAGPDQPVRPTAGGLRPSGAPDAAQLLRQAQQTPVPGSLPNDPWQQGGNDPWAVAKAMAPPGQQAALAYHQA